VGHGNTVARISAKVAISVDPSLLARAERLRKTTGESRSALVGRALRLLLREDATRSAAHAYVDAYRRMPETDTDLRDARAIATRSLASLPWDDE
jgi:Arc/MetJ family transcription regulator